MTSKRAPKAATRSGRYRILCAKLRYPTSRKVIERILGGDHGEGALAARDANIEIHLRGEVVDNIPPESIPHELAAGNIEEAK